MGNKANFFNISLKNILHDGQPIMEQARIRLIYYGLLLAFLGVVAIIPNVYNLHEGMQFTACVFLLCSFVALFKYFTYIPNWKVVSHIALIVGSGVVFVSVYIMFQDINIIVMQLVILVILFGYYMLGVKSGTAYSLVNLLFVLAFMLYEKDTTMLRGVKPEKIDAYTLIVSVFFNFILIMYIQGHFYDSFLRNIKQLKELAYNDKILNENLGIAIDKAEKSSKVQSEFLSTMSHEIRTPLNAVIGMSNLLMMESPRPDQRENLEILRFAAGNLLSLINDVLDFNKIESGKISFENIKINLSELLHNICGGQIVKANEKGINFQLNVDDFFKSRYVIGDPTRLSQILFNLIGNAIKFTKRGNVKVSVTKTEDRHNEVVIRFSVKDSGIGIAKDKIGTIFEPFTQESITTTRQYGGTGLGLAIVKRLLELQESSIRVKSEINIGSEFYFDLELPVSADWIEQEPKVQPIYLPIAKDDYPVSSMQVLIAEDNPVNVMLMKKLLSKWKITPVIAENGERAIELLKYGNFDIILMDLQMPVLDGFEASKAIRKMADPKKANVPIIALTASALFDIRDRVYSSGMNDYVSKPFKPNELLEKMLNLVVGVSQ